MSVDKDTVLRVAKLARIAVSDAEAETMKGELNGILDWVEQLQAVDVEGVEPMTAVVETRIKMRTDVVNDGEKAGDIVQNAPLQEDQFFMVPKVVE